MKKLFFILFLLIPSSTHAQALLSYGIRGASLSTASNGAVTGTAFALPSSYANIITWTVVADGSALSSTLEASLDNTTWYTVDTQTTATGGIKNYGFTGIKFVRISQVSRTVGTATTGTLTVVRGFINNGTLSSGSFSFSGTTSFTGQTLFADGTAAAPSIAFISDTACGFYRVSGSAGQFYSSCSTGFGARGNTAGVIAGSTFGGIELGSLAALNWGVTNEQSAVDVKIGRTAAGQAYVGTATVQPVINGTLTTSTAIVCTVADTVETDLWTYTLPAGALNADGRGLRVTVWGHFAPTANLKTVIGYIDGVSVVNSSAVAGNNSNWEITENVLRIGASSEAVNSEVRTTLTSTGTASIRASVQTLSAITANAIVIKVTGTNGTAAANDICVRGAIVETIR